MASGVSRHLRQSPVAGKEDLLVWLGPPTTPVVPLTRPALVVTSVSHFPRWQFEWDSSFQHPRSSLLRSTECQTWKSLLQKVRETRTCGLHVLSPEMEVMWDVRDTSAKKRDTEVSAYDVCCNRSSRDNLRKGVTEERGPQQRGEVNRLPC